jgi:predicted transcriptional regulator
MNKAYRKDLPHLIARIEADRKALGISQAELALRAGISERTYRNMLADGKAFGRTVRQCSMALRSIGKDRHNEGEVL